MAYERMAIAETPNALPNMPQAEMREERVLDPYAQRRQMLAAAAVPGAKAVTVGQLDKAGEMTAVDLAKTAETVSLSPQVAAFARKEQKFRQEQAKLNAQAKALEAERAEIAELKALKAKLAAKDYTGIENLVDYEAYSQYQISKLQGEDPVQKELAAIKAEVSGIKKTDEERVSKAFESAVAQRRDAVTKLVAVDEQFSSIKVLKREEAVVQHILDTWEHDAEELSPEQAAKEVEELLLERAQKYASLPKLKKQESVATATVEEKKTLPPLRPGLKTLTNQVTTGDVKKSLRPLSLMNESERYAEARRRAIEKLNSQQPRSA